MQNILGRRAFSSIKATMNYVNIINKFFLFPGSSISAKIKSAPEVNKIVNKRVDL